MRSIVLGGIAAASLALALAGCASTAGSAPDVPASPGATDSPAAPAAPVGTGADAQARLADLPTPSATEPVLAIGTVLEQDGGAILCVSLAFNLIGDGLRDALDPKQRKGRH